MTISLKIFRNNFFIKNPGRDVGGVFGFMAGFRTETWLASSVLLVSLPAVLHLSHVLQRRHQAEDTTWNYGWNFFVFSAAIAQQVNLVDFHSVECIDQMHQSLDIGQSKCKWWIELDSLTGLRIEILLTTDLLM